MAAHTWPTSERRKYTLEKQCSSRRVQSSIQQAIHIPSISLLEVVSATCIRSQSTSRAPWPHSSRSIIHLIHIIARLLVIPTILRSFLILELLLGRVVGSIIGLGGESQMSLRMEIILLWVWFSWADWDERLADFWEQTYSGGDYALSGGTSASTPIFAAVINRINEERLNVGKKPIGFLNPSLYANPSMLNDITNGTNPGCSTDGFSAVPG